MSQKRVGGIAASLLIILMAEGGCYPHNDLRAYKPKGTPDSEVQTAKGDTEEKQEFLYIEQMNDGTRRLPPSANDMPVDYKSKIIVVPNRARLKEFVSNYWTESEINLMGAVKTLTTMNAVYIDTIQREALTQRKPLSDFAIQELVAPAATADDKALDEAILGFKAASANVKSQSSAASIRLQLDSSVKTLMRTPLPEKTVDKVALAHQLATEGITYLNARAAENAKNAPLLTIKAYVSHGKGDPQQIHVLNYDDIKDKGKSSKGVIYQPDQPADDAKANNPGATDKTKANTQDPTAANFTKVQQFLDSVNAGKGKSADSIKADAAAQKVAEQSWFYNKAPAGYIDLAGTSADHGDTLSVLATLDNPTDATKGAANAGDGSSLSPKSMDFAVDRLDFSWKITGNLIFANRIGNTGNNFVAAPSAALSLHYRPRVDDGCEPKMSSRDGFWHTWNAIDPAIGVNVAALNFSDTTTTKKTNASGTASTSTTSTNSSLQVGIGVQMSFVDDLFQVGYGYDLQASKNHQYWYFGISIFDALNQAGKLGLKLSK